MVSSRWAHACMDALRGRMVGSVEAGSRWNVFNREMLQDVAVYGRTVWRRMSGGSRGRNHSFQLQPAHQSGVSCNRRGTGRHRSPLSALGLSGLFGNQLDVRRVNERR